MSSKRDGLVADIADAPRERGGAPALERRLRFVFEQSRLSMLTSLLGAVMVVFLFRAVTPAPVLFWWLVSYGAIVITRLAIVNRALRRPEGVARGDAVAFIALTFVAGAAWGCMPVLFPPPGSEMHLALAVLWAGGMIAGSLIAYAPVLEVTLAFMVPAMIPIGVAFTIASTEIAPGMAIAVLLFFMFAAAISVRMSHAIARELKLERANAELLARIDEDRRRITALNTRLEADLDRHRRTARDLQAAREHAELLSTLDGLTGIANRRHFDTMLTAEWGRALRTKDQVSLIMCDIDAFKTYNDTFGHPAGDECLRQVGSVLASFARRPGDLAARYGGEEFALLLPGTGADDALAIAEQLRARIAGLDLGPAGTDQARVSASLGIATVRPTRVEQPADLVGRADAALYRAKREGRNRVVANA